MAEHWCCECGRMPARMMLPDSERRMCGVCGHRLAVLRDLARRVKEQR